MFVRVAPNPGELEILGEDEVDLDSKGEREYDTLEDKEGVLKEDFVPAISNEGVSVAEPVKEADAKEVPVGKYAGEDEVHWD